MYNLSERLQNPYGNQRLAVPQVYMQGLIRRHSLNRLPNLLFRTIPTKMLPVADKLLQFGNQQAPCVFLRRLSTMS